MSRILTTLFAFTASVIVTTGLPDMTLAQKRVAFVVGTDKYDNLDQTRQLQRAVNDARAVGATFKSLGFEVIAAENLTRGQFNDQFQKFLDKLKAGDTAAIYYAGHGVEIEGLNFLLPRDIPAIKFGRQEQIKRESVSVAELLLDLRSRTPEIALIILDACRDNPLIPDEMRSIGTRGGLAPLKGEPPKGTFIMYSAGAGESALDRLPGNDPDRENSIFTRKLVPLLKTKGLALHDMARQLRTDVIALASTVPHSQRPAYYDGVDGKYCLAGCDVATITPKAVYPSAALQEAAKAWALVKDATSTAALDAFIRRYMDTFYADLARMRIEELKAKQAAISKLETAKQTDDRKREEAKSPQVEPENPFTAELARRERERLALQQRDDERKRMEGGTFENPGGAVRSTVHPGSHFRDCPECPEVVVVPAGEFMMGSPQTEETRDAAEGPQRKVTIAKPFAVGKFEVTFAEWAACVAGGGCVGNKNPEDQAWGRGKRPVINVSWDDATQYASWLAKKTGQTYRLLTEAEWEYAARGVTKASAQHTPFSTGATISTDQANYDGGDTYGSGKKGVNRGKTMEVGSFPRNAFGLHDMHGNVWEWVQDCYKDSYTGAPTDGSAVTATDCAIRVLRGGSWSSFPLILRSAFRYRPPFGRSERIGFRVARTL